MLFYFKIGIKDAVKLHIWTNASMKSTMFLNLFGQISFVHVLENGTLNVQEYPIGIEVRSVTFKSKEKCPFVAFHNNIDRVFYILDKGENLSVWAQIVYPENKGLYIVVEPYGPKLLESKYSIQYEIASGFCTRTLVSYYFKISFHFHKCKSLVLIFFKTDLFPYMFFINNMINHQFLSHSFHLQYLRPLCDLHHAPEEISVRCIAFFLLSFLLFLVPNFSIKSAVRAVSTWAFPLGSLTKRGASGGLSGRGWHPMASFTGPVAGPRTGLVV